MRTDIIIFRRYEDVTRSGAIQATSDFQLLHIEVCHMFPITPLSYICVTHIEIHYQSSQFISHFIYHFLTFTELEELGTIATTEEPEVPGDTVCGIIHYNRCCIFTLLAYISFI